MKIAFIVDKKGWVQHSRAKTLQVILPFSISIYTWKDSFDPKRFDAIYYSNIFLMKKAPIQHDRIFAAITSHKGLDDPEKLSRLTDKCVRFSANSTILCGKLRKKGFQVEYIPNGVNSFLFQCSHKRKKDHTAVIGWVGNKDRKTKNFPIVNKLRLSLPEVQWKIVSTRKSGGRVKSHTSMCQYYHTLDYLIVCSSTEGTPNPALEAASCGVPIISTPVGNMIEIVSDMKTGLLVDFGYRSMKKAIQDMVKVSAKKHYEMKQNIRSVIEESWDWSHRIPLYEAFFRE